MTNDDESWEKHVVGSIDRNQIEPFESISSDFLADVKMNAPIEVTDLKCKVFESTTEYETTI
jgi:hypothetical protein